MSRSRVERWGTGVAELGRDWLWSVSGRPLSPRSFLSGAVGAAEASAAGLWALLPSARAPAAWLETANKLRAYRLFAFADTLVPDAARGWSAVDSRLRLMDPYSRVWATEGLGYWFARRDGMVAMRSEPVARRVLVPMHTGAGLALAERALGASTGRDLASVLRRFHDDARELAREGFDEVVLEALGLVAVTLFPGLVDAIGHECSQDHRLSALFWHGVGRGLYFLPLQFLPVTRARQRPAEIALRDPASERGRRNALAGVAWAMALVNLQDPEVVMEWLRENANVPDRAALRDGIASALVVWMASAPGDGSIEEWARYDPPDRPLWDATAAAALAAARAATSAPSTVFRLQEHP